jgi:hypothetical protein
VYKFRIWIRRYNFEVRKVTRSDVVLSVPIALPRLPGVDFLKFSLTELGCCLLVHHTTLMMCLSSFPAEQSDSLRTAALENFSESCWSTVISSCSLYCQDSIIGGCCQFLKVAAVRRNLKSISRSSQGVSFSLARFGVRQLAAVGCLFTDCLCAGQPQYRWTPQHVQIFGGGHPFKPDWEYGGCDDIS